MPLKDMSDKRVRANDSYYISLKSNHDHFHLNKACAEVN